MTRRITLLGMLLAAPVVGLGCKSHLHPHNIPPAAMLMHPGPGVGGPGPGVLMRADAVGSLADAAGLGGCGVGATSQLAFVRPEGMSVQWDVFQSGAFESEPLVVPGRQNFGQAAIYRLKLTNIPGREGLELYPTVEVGPATPRTDAFLAHTPIPIEFTEEDFDQVQSGNFVTKVIYLPDPEFQELALAGVETLVSTRLDPGVDPIVEADRRGSILAIIRLGNKDLELPGGMAGGDAAVQPAGYCSIDGNCGAAAAGGYGGGAGGPLGAPGAGFAPGAVPPNYLAAGTEPTWGMPMSGTPIGLPGPPHIPLGVPAGLQKHVIKNHTYHHMPHPTRKVEIDVKQTPGFTYPKPAHKVRIRENIKAPWKGFHIPWKNHLEIVR